MDIIIIVIIIYICIKLMKKSKREEEEKRIQKKIDLLYKEDPQKAEEYIKDLEREEEIELIENMNKATRRSFLALLVGVYAKPLSTVVLCIIVGLWLTLRN